MSGVLVTASKAPVWKMPFTCAELGGILENMLREAGHLGPEQGPAMEVLLTGDREMEKLHLKSLGCAGPTNVLSFPALCGAGENLPPFLGSIALSVDTMARECFLYGQEPCAHTIRLMAHGLAHLMGLDHGDAMWNLCNKLEAAAKTL
ncbi:rRNA maturation RNase YbeY [Desulfovibrio sp. OttesenSCG-928-G15]|nr:rRNA maturation RNase YbeY [Desulfovibrio sp. OttesenSCG-928-G15]